MNRSSMSRLAECLERARALEPIITEHAAESERNAQLSPKVVDALHDAGLFRVMLPAAMRGSELTIPEQCQLVEEIARFDGATGWNFAIGSGGPIIAGFAARDAFEKNPFDRPEPTGSQPEVDRSTAGDGEVHADRESDIAAAPRGQYLGSATPEKGLADD